MKTAMWRWRSNTADAQKKGTNLSPTALKMEVGSRWRLKRSASIEAIERGLKKLSALGD
jgi:hypothetical protein